MCDSIVSAMGGCLVFLVADVDVCLDVEFDVAVVAAAAADVVGYADVVNVANAVDDVDVAGIVEGGCVVGVVGTNILLMISMRNMCTAPRLTMLSLRVNMRKQQTCHPILSGRAWFSRLHPRTNIFRVDRHTMPKYAKGP